MPKPKAPPATSASPWLPPEYDVADAAAIQALHRGDATPAQQQRALNWIIDNAAGAYELSFRPGSEGRRDTDFAEGRRFVGLQIVKMLKLNLAKLRSDHGGREQE